MSEQSNISLQVNEKIKSILGKHGIDWRENVDLCKEIKKMLYYQGADLLKATVMNEAKKNKNNCPVCNRTVNLRRVSITKQSAKCLINLYNLTSESSKRYFHIDDIGTDKNTGGAWGALRHWGLIAIPDIKGVNPQGNWVLTKKGMDFALGKMKIPKYARVYNRKCYGLEGDLISIADIIGHDKWKTLL